MRPCSAAVRPFINHQEMEGGQRCKQRGLVGGSTARFGEVLQDHERGQPMQGGEVVVEELSLCPKTWRRMRKAADDVPS